LPLTTSVAAEVERYLAARRQAGASQDPATALLWNERGGGGYTVITAQQLLTEVIRRAGLKPATARAFPARKAMLHRIIYENSF
jgi:hypothetical protein